MTALLNSRAHNYSKRNINWTTLKEWIIKDSTRFVHCNKEFNKRKEMTMDHSTETSYSSTVAFFTNIWRYICIASIAKVGPGKVRRLQSKSYYVGIHLCPQPIYVLRESSDKAGPLCQMKGLRKKKINVSS